MSVAPAPLKILVVEDDPVSRMALVNLLGRIPGAEVVQAPDGQVAWSLLVGGLRPIVCCSDIAMPGLDGLALMERARAHPVLCRLPIVLITGSSDRSTVQQAITNGAAGYIIKPFVGVDTRNTVQRIMRETYQRQSEAPASTRARINQDAVSLARMLSELRDLAFREQGNVSHTPDSADLPARLTRLRSACLTLGLWNAAAMVKLPRPGPDRQGHLVAVLGEIICAAQDQLTRLHNEVAMTPAPQPAHVAPVALIDPALAPSLPT
ncbi:MAG TPA: response regulator [Ramlibacter sp.]|nr:response regulator [Ramlibacter sp.]